MPRRVARRHSTPNATSTAWNSRPDPEVADRAPSVATLKHSAAGDRGKPPSATPEDHAAFREAVADVKPLVWDRVHHESTPPAIPRQRLHDEAAALDESLRGPVLVDLYLEGGDEAAWKDSLPSSAAGLAPRSLGYFRTSSTCTV